mgnify:CR=1 FL=1
MRSIRSVPSNKSKLSKRSKRSTNKKVKSKSAIGLRCRSKKQLKRPASKTHSANHKRVGSINSHRSTNLRNRGNKSLLSTSKVKTTNAKSSGISRCRSVMNKTSGLSIYLKVNGKKKKNKRSQNSKLNQSDISNGNST